MTIMTFYIQPRLTLHDLFAITVVAMLIGHAAQFFFNDQLWMRVPDRMLMPVFLVAAGYNVGRKNGANIWIAALGLVFVKWHFMNMLLPLNFLCTLIMIRFIIDPLWDFMVKNGVRFLAVTAALVAGVFFTDSFSEYGTLAVLMAIGGRMRRDEAELPALINVKRYFVFIWLLYLVTVYKIFNFSYLYLLCIFIGSGAAMYVLYDFRQLILNGLRKKSAGFLPRIWRFIGHKSLEIYAIHLALFYLAVALLG